ncbi:MAG TPA: GNAT family protein [Pyrinomonadaceae bacterium]|nr:GNAT family protein [Pyrinomonadaceae bacterium]
MKVEVVVLESELVRLEPLRLEHLPDLCEIGLDESIWLWTANVVRTESDMRRYIETALEEFKRKVSLPFVTIDKVSNKIVGSTRFGNIDVKNRRAEIGWTWINPRRQRTFINTEAKRLMLAHAFETWHCVRVELKTDVLNEKSRNAIRRLGAIEEGILRRHAITGAGRIRDTVYYSILDSEWSGVKANLENKIKNPL